MQVALFLGGRWSATRGKRNDAIRTGVRPQRRQQQQDTKNKKERKEKQTKGKSTSERSSRGRSDKKVHTDKAGDNSNADLLGGEETQANE